MNRWTNLLLAFLAASLVGVAGAQSDAPKPNVRQFPKDAKRAELVIVNAPEIALDGKPDRLSPGARIRDVNNFLVMSAGLINQKLVVNYVRENTGLVHNVWILNSEEIKQKMLGQPAGILSNIRSIFDAPTADDNGGKPSRQPSQ